MPAVIANKYRASLVMVCCLVAQVTSAQAPSEEEVKAAFLYNFTQFITWPDSAYSAPDAPFVIGVYGKNPFDDFLENLVNGEYVGNHPIIVTNISEREDAEKVHMLYVDDQNRMSIKNISIWCEHKSILLVSDADKTFEEGGMIKLVTENKRLRFQVNKSRVQSAGIVMSSKLLRLAQVVNETEN